VHESRAITKEHRMSSRNVITEEIRTALERDPRIAHAAEVAVAERAGRVTLRGTVRSIHQRQTAVEIAKSVPGVRAVDDGLRIDPRDHTRDSEIRGAALQALMSDDGVPAGVDVAVANGWATLKGEVKHQRESDAAFAATSEIAGVGGITNRITVVSPGADR
jgi:osmotically-inducible protein OsmY